MNLAVVRSGFGRSHPGSRQILNIKDANMKTTTKTLTAAEQYARLKADGFEKFLEESFSAESLKDVDLYEVKCDSGMVFKCRKLDTRFIRNGGQMPMSLSAQVVASQNGTANLSEDEQEARATEEFKRMSPGEQQAAIEASCRILRYIAVEPRLIVGDVGDQRNAIPLSSLTMQDFASLAQWANGGDAAEGLKTFRSKRK